MSAALRALERLRHGGVLAPLPSGAGFGVYARGDRRRRPEARVSAADARALETDGAIAAAAHGYVITAAGLARLRREGARESEAYLAQHADIVDRAAAAPAGGLRKTRAVAQSSVVQRLAALQSGAGAPWLSSEELLAAQRLRADWEASQAGLVRGSDWSSAPKSGAARGPGAAQEAALAKRCDARRRMAAALDALSPPLRRVVERVCLREDGLEALERAEGWPSRSGKLALKLALAQLAAALAG